MCESDTVEVNGLMCWIVRSAHASMTLCGMPARSKW